MRLARRSTHGVCDSDRRLAVARPGADDAGRNATTARRCARRRCSSTASRSRCSAVRRRRATSFVSTIQEAAPARPRRQKSPSWDLRVLARAAHAIQRRAARRVLGSRSFERRRHAFSVLRLQPAARGRVAGTLARARSGVRDSRREPRRRDAARHADAARIALAPERYENKRRERLRAFPRPQPVRRSRRAAADASKWDFVVQSADAALWVTGLRPRGKGFELDPGARVDTGRWVQVTGTVRREGSRSWIEARGIELTSAPTRSAGRGRRAHHAGEPPPAVVFSTPVPDEHRRRRDDRRPSPVLARHGQSARSKIAIRVSYATSPQSHGARANAAGFLVRLQRRQSRRRGEVRQAARALSDGEESSCWKASRRSTASRSRRGR